MRPVAVLAAILTLAACGNAPAQQAASTSATTATHSTADIAYLAAVRPSVQGSTDADLISLGRHACDLLDGNTLLDVVDGLARQGFSAHAAASIATAAIPAYCPQHKDQLMP